MSDDTSNNPAWNSLDILNQRQLLTFGGTGIKRDIPLTSFGLVEGQEKLFAAAAILLCQESDRTVYLRKSTSMKMEEELNSNHPTTVANMAELSEP
ncbi:hypothetical protein TNCV_2832371 [Trichonephila clavipes]|nr:hypothetical protein TNCV_2832371 [Trichonephila clavipes]